MPAIFNGMQPAMVKAVMIGKRMIEILGIAMIGEGMIAALRPRRYSNLWNCGPKWMRACASSSARHPERTRAIGMLELLAGTYLALRETNV
jgi:hypothetical protein